MEQSEQIDQLAAALCEAQKESLFAITDSDNPYFKSKYADLSSVWSVAREPLTKNGLAVVQTFGTDADGKPEIFTTLMHKSGQWVRGKIKMNPVKADPQSVGSAITYGRRYSLSAIVGIAPTDDDDGNAASGRTAPNKPVDRKTPVAPPDNSPPQGPQPITEPQRKKLFAMMKEQGMDKDTIAQFSAYLKSVYGDPLTREAASLIFDDFDGACDRFAVWKMEHEQATA